MHYNIELPVTMRATPTKQVLILKCTTTVASRSSIGVFGPSTCIIDVAMVDKNIVPICGCIEFGIAIVKPHIID